jgi:aspartyl-tRNA(Asn)/glutamyl-tRNA(Gln) amidotransferase subunit B
MNDSILNQWEPVIGLEIHLQLNTQTKLFSSAPNHFGDEPNTNISVVCTGQPGALPVLNKEAITKGIKLGTALKANIALFSRFDRKSYFYPDLPRGFQITQFDTPLIKNGSITTDVNGETKTFQIERAHLEDDAGMLKHFPTFAGVDYNRSGAPLIEIVSKPCLHSAAEASAYAQAIRNLALYLDISDGNMEEGSLRIDVNISVRPKGETKLRPRIEIKNMNSFHFLELAVESEIKRQVSLYLQNPDKAPEELIPPGTYRWDVETGQAVMMRRKESADDYRYFPEPDLSPILLSQETIDEISRALPELPHDRFLRYQKIGLPAASAQLLVNDKKLGEYFESALAHSSQPITLSNWILVEFAGMTAKINQTILSSKLPPIHVAKLVEMIGSGKITGKIAKLVAEEMLQSPELDPEIIVSKNPNYQPIGDLSVLDEIVERTLKENPQSVIDYKNGNFRAFGALVGYCMKLTMGKANPQMINELLKKKLS